MWRKYQKIGGEMRTKYALIHITHSHWTVGAHQCSLVEECAHFFESALIEGLLYCKQWIQRSLCVKPFYEPCFTVFYVRQQPQPCRSASKFTRHFLHTVCQVSSNFLCHLDSRLWRQNRCQSEELLLPRCLLALLSSLKQKRVGGNNKSSFYRPLESLLRSSNLPLKLQKKASESLVPQKSKNISETSAEIKGKYKSILSMSKT